MNAVTLLEGMGLTLGVSENGKLAVEGLKHLPPEQRAYALQLAQENKAPIVEALQRPSTVSDEPTPAQLGHARRMLVDCPATGGKRHCWHCSRCQTARSCLAWRGRRFDVEFFRQSGKPYSLFLVEALEALGVVQ
jgi:hypothetical protein